MISLILLLLYGFTLLPLLNLLGVLLLSLISWLEVLEEVWELLLSSRVANYLIKSVNFYYTFKFIFSFDSSSMNFLMVALSFSFT